MTESHPGSSPLLSNYSDGGENKINGLNDSATVSERSGSARIPQVSCFNLEFCLYVLHANNETDSGRSGSSMISELGV